MAGAISSTGVGSGLDVNSIVSSLVAVEKQPLTLLQAKASVIQAKVSAFGTLKGQLANLADLSSKLATATSWSPMLADSSDSASVAATASTSAAAGQHTVGVQQLAQAQVLASGSFAASTATVGTGTLTIEIGTTASGVFTRKADATPLSIAIDAAHSTLAGVRDAINAAGAGVTASIVTGSGGARLVLRGADGAASSLRITAADDDTNATDAAGLSALAWDPASPPGAGKNLTQTQAAQDAKFTIDGVDLTASSNTTTEALEGLTLTLKQVTTKDVAVGVTVQSVAVRKNVNDFVTAYNALNTLLRQQTQADPGGTGNGALQADATATGLLYQMRSMLHGSVTGMSGANSLNAAGIVLQKDGSLQVDETRFAAIAKTPGRLSQLFSQAQSGADTSTAGFGVRFKAWAKALTDDTGSIASRVAGLQRSITDNRKQQDRVQDRLDATEARLRKQYQQLDSQMTTLNQRMAQMKSALGLA